MHILSWRKSWFNDERTTFLQTCIFLSNIVPMQGRSGRFVLIALIGKGALRPHWCIFTDRQHDWILGILLGKGGEFGRGKSPEEEEEEKRMDKKSTLDIIDIFSDIVKLVVLCPWEFCPTYFNKTGVLFVRFFIGFLNIYYLAMKIKQYTKIWSTSQKLFPSLESKLNALTHVQLRGSVTCCCTAADIYWGFVITWHQSAFIHWTAEINLILNANLKSNKYWKRFNCFIWSDTITFDT